MKLSVIIPTYNEERRIARTLASINDYLKRQEYDSEIIVVDGGSRDKTCDIVIEKQKSIKNLRLFKIKGLGKGHAVREGMLAAKGLFRIFTDADNSTTIDQVEKMWPEFEKGYDIVIGSRDVKGAVLEPAQPFFRRLTGILFKIYRKLIVGLWDIQDTQCGFKGFSARAASDVFSRAKINRFSFDPEILLIGRKLGYRIKEVPVRWSNSPESTVNFSSMINMAFDILKIRWNFVVSKYG